MLMKGAQVGEVVYLILFTGHLLFPESASQFSAGQPNVTDFRATKPNRAHIEPHDKKDTFPAWAASHCQSV